MKRGNDTSQLRPEEVEALNEQDGEEAGNFKRANKDVLQGRKIYKISKSSFENKDSSSSMQIPLSTLTVPSFTVPQQAPVISTSPDVSRKPSSDEEETYKQSMKKLNDAFLLWINKQANENVVTIWTDAMDDYIKYSNEITTKYPKAAAYFNTQQVAPIPFNVAAPPVANKLVSTTTAIAESVAKAVSFPGFQFGATAAPKPVEVPAPVAPVISNPVVQSTTAAAVAPSNTAAPFAGFSFSGGVNTSKSTTADAISSAGLNKSEPVATPSNVTAAAPFAGFSFGAVNTKADTKIAPAQVATDTISSTVKPFTFGGFTKPAATDASATGGPTGGFFNLTPVTTSAATTNLSASLSGFSNPFASNTGFTGGLDPTKSSSTTALPGFGFNNMSSTGTGFNLKPFVSVPNLGGGLGSGAGVGDEEEGGDDEGEPILEPEKILRNEEDTDKQLHEVPCKLFKFKSETKEWSDLGKCSLRVTESQDTKKQRIIIRSMMGKPLVNAYFYKDMKFEQVKNSIKFMAFVADEDGSKGMRSFNVKVNAAEVENTMKILNAGVQSIK